MWPLFEFNKNTTGWTLIVWRFMLRLNKQKAYS